MLLYIRFDGKYRGECDLCQGNMNEMLQRALGFADPGQCPLLQMQLQPLQNLFPSPTVRGAGQHDWLFDAAGLESFLHTGKTAWTFITGKFVRLGKQYDVFGGALPHENHDFLVQLGGGVPRVDQLKNHFQRHTLGQVPPDKALPTFTFGSGYLCVSKPREVDQQETPVDPVEIDLARLAWRGTGAGDAFSTQHHIYQGAFPHVGSTDEGNLREIRLRQLTKGRGAAYERDVLKRHRFKTPLQGQSGRWRQDSAR